MKLFSADPPRFDLVITDQTMPQMPGLQFAGKLLKIRNDIPIILCTGHSESATPEAVQKMGIRELVLKPADRHELAQTIRRVLDSKVVT